MGYLFLLYITAFHKYGLISNVFAVFRPYIVTEHRFSNTQCAMIATIRSLFSLFCMFFIELFYRKVSIRTGTFIAVLLSALSYLLFGFARNIWVYYIAAIFAGIGYGLETMMPISLLIDRWLAYKKALALSICTIGSGYFSSHYCCRYQRIPSFCSFFMLAASILLLGIMIFLLLHNEPQDKHLKAS